MLRLPDVIGPYDDTGRFWAYIEWIKNSKEFPIELVTKNVMNNIILKKEEELKKEMNFVYSKDVTDIILNVSGVISNSSVDPKTLFLSYNLACEENITLPDFLDQIVLLI